MGLFATLRHIKRLADVEERLRECEAQMKAVDREWSDVHDYLQRQLGKISKRAKALDRETAAEPASGSSSTGDAAQAAEPPVGPYGSKTATILRQIAARRGG